ncbi:MAG: hypothetical protein HDR55_04920 [Treponema sp.]|nr:hypothetical protein [Treponema sp.]
MVLRRFGLVAALLAAVCCGALLAGCANGDNDENDSDYEEKKALDYWNKNYDADDFEWEDIDDNKDEIVGTWRADREETRDNYEEPEEIGFYTSMKFVIDSSFEHCKFTFIDDSSKCKTKMRYTYAKGQFPKEFVDGDGYKYKLEFDNENCIAKATAENLTLKQLAEVLHCEGFSISTKGNKLLLKNRKNDGKDLPATWLFTAGAGGESERYGSSYVIARAE